MSQSIIVYSQAFLKLAISHLYLAFLFAVYKVWTCGDTYHRELVVSSIKASWYAQIFVW